MKKLMLSLVLTASLGGSVAAQDRVERTPAEKAKMQTQVMVKELELTPAQVIQVEEINLHYMEKGNALRAERKEGPGKHHGERKELLAERDAALQKALTPEQFEKWSAREKAMMEKRRSRALPVKAVPAQEPAGKE